MDKENPARRPIASRSSSWAIALSAKLARSGVTPNSISVVSIIFAVIGGALILWFPGVVSYILAALCVQLRLICNLLDGMVAIEGGKKTKVGPIYNEFPDRIADSALLIPLGYTIGIPELGWAAALIAALTAYVRVFGGSLGLEQDFSGIMAKQRRMAMMTFGLVAQAIEISFSGTCWILLISLWLIVIGSAVTCVTRTQKIASLLERI